MDLEEIQEKLRADEKSAVTAQKRASGMSLRDRWRRAMFFQKVDRLPNFEFGYWAETLSAWHKQGLPPEVKDEASAYAYFGIENWGGVPVDVMGLRPPFNHEIIEETSDYITYRDSGSGCLAQINKHGHKSIPHYIDFLLKDRRSWEEHYKPRLQYTAERLPANIAERAAELSQRTVPVCIGIGSMVGIPRNWIGFENIALMVHDDPELLEDIVETLCNLVCQTLAQALPYLEVDFGAGWEDICFNSGPIVGYDFMRRVVMPRYQRITALLRKHGCHIAWTDCDGNIMPILDVFWEGGINCCFPVEVNAGSDPVEIRRRYPEMRLQGGFCKMRLTAGKEAIRMELMRLLPLVK